MPTPNELRSALADLSTLAGRELDELWKSVTNADQAKAALLEVLPPLTYAYGLASGALAADWYDETRDELNVDGRFSAVVPEVDAEGTDILARWGVGPLFDAEPDWDAARTLVAGGVQYKIADVARKTVMGSTFDDPQARGWQRSASNGCDFCKMLASRGTVYTRGTVDFSAHHHCRCVAVMAFTGRELLVKPYEPSTRRALSEDIIADTPEWTDWKNSPVGQLISGIT